MIIFYILIAVFIAWIWVEYYRLIDIYEKESLKYLIFTFLLGSLSVFIVLLINKFILNHFTFELNGSLINDFLYSVFSIGLVEEFAKTVPFLIVFFAFKKNFNEPIDILALFCISALGFSAAENVLYFNSYGPSIINNRAILSTVGHMFDTALIAYGVIRFKYHHSTKGIIEILFFFFLAAISHGFYDFWLIFEGTKSGGCIITILYFFITISVFSVIINNALDNSTSFTYKQVVNSDKVSGRLLTYYGILFGLQFVMLIFYENINYAISNLLSSILLTGFIIVVTCVRLSRFKLIKGRWNVIKLEFPFSFSQGDPFGMKSSRFLIRIKGDAYNEAYINIYLEEYFTLIPVSNRNSSIEYPRLTFMEKKIFLKNDDSLYIAKVIYDEKTDQHDKILLMPKKSNISMINDKYPIVAILKHENLDKVEESEKLNKSFKFIEWAYIKSKE